MKRRPSCSIEIGHVCIMRVRRAAPSGYTPARWPAERRTVRARGARRYPPAARERQGLQSPTLNRHERRLSRGGVCVRGNGSPRLAGTFQWSVPGSNRRPPACKAGRVQGSPRPLFGLPMPFSETRRLRKPLRKTLPLRSIDGDLGTDARVAPKRIPVLHPHRARNLAPDSCASALANVPLSRRADSSLRRFSMRQLMATPLETTNPGHQATSAVPRLAWPP